MTKAQWAAINNYCEENYCTRQELVEALRNNGTVDRSTKLEELGDYAKGDTYEDMLTFLEENT